jgi:hypothetical protein
VEVLSLLSVVVGLWHFRDGVPKERTPLNLQRLNDYIWLSEVIRGTLILKTALSLGAVGSKTNANVIKGIN